MDDNTAMIFDVQRFSTTDGPGIRTVVFFKGCNMRCWWCHNPEGMESRSELEFTAAKCIHCGLCAAVCRNQTHEFSEQSHEFLRDRCTGCMACAAVCPTKALRIIGRPYTLEDCMKEILEDKPFYQRSGGGVTLSGGEVLLQADFAETLLRRCHAEGISCAIESNLSLPFTVIERLVPYLDLVMTDIKHIDNDVHKAATGIGNERILQNIEALDRLGIPLIVRTPIIPSFNQDATVIGAISQWLCRLKKLRYYELLTYNSLGCDKAKRLGKTQEIAYGDPNETIRLAQYAKDTGICVLADGREIYPA